MQVPFYRHGLDAGYAEMIGSVLDSPILTSGQVGREVEARLCSFFEVPHAKLTNSWTNGAVATLLALDIGPGCDVIVPAMSFVATANVVELVGARPVFADVDPATLLVTPEAVASVVTPRTRAVIPVHLYGQMVDIGALRAVLRPGIAIIEDAAHCFEGTLRGERPGAQSDAAIFSFYATKNITCGEGGAIVTRDAALAARLQHTVLHGMSAGAADRFKAGRYRHWDMERLGTKANLTDLLAALLPAQIDGVYARLAERERLVGRYRAALRDHPAVRLPAELPGMRSAQHLFPIHLAGSERDRVLAALNEGGVGATVNYTAIPATKYYRNKYGLAPGLFPVAETWGEGTLSLPLFPGLRDDEQDHVIATLLEGVIPAKAQEGRLTA